MKTKKNSRLAIVGVIAGLASLALVWKLFPVADWIQRLMSWIESFGLWAPVAFFGLYLVLALLSFPSTLLNVASGILFSYPIALGVAWAAGFAAALVAFQLGRHLFRDRLEKHLEKSPKFETLVEEMEHQGLKMVLLARLNPFIPASLKSYGLGATDLPFSKYGIGTAIGQLPIAAAHVYLGWVGGRAAMNHDDPPSPLEIGLLAGGLIVSVVLLGVVYWYGKRALQKND